MILRALASWQLLPAGTSLTYLCTQADIKCYNKCTRPPVSPQLAHPYYIFTSHGYSVTIASIKGGEIPVDEASLAAPYLTPEVEKFLLDGTRWFGRGHYVHGKHQQFSAAGSITHPYAPC